MSQAQPKTLEYWLNRATDSFLEDAERNSFAKSFCDQLNSELEGPQIACRLLVHKIQSPQEAEALHGLSAIDLCVRCCGPRFHNEMSKFRFLNEVIKLLSPKYLGDRTPEKVKTRTVELLYSWSKSLRHLPKIAQSYQMLKDQKIILADPKYMDEIYEPPPPPPKPRHSSLLDDEKEKLLATLLTSKNPDDLQAANRLIKSMVKEEEKRAEQTTKRMEDLEMVRNNTRLLAEMLATYSRTTALQDVELMNEFFDQLHACRPKLFQYAAEYAEKEDSLLVEVLQINDEASKVMEDFQTKILPEHRAHVAKISKTRTQDAASTNRAAQSSLLNLDIPAYQSGSSLADLTGDFSASSSSDDVNLLGCFGTPLLQRRSGSTGSSISQLNDVFGPISQMPSSTSDIPSSTVTTTGGSLPLQTVPNTVAKPSTYVARPKGLLDLDELSESLMQQNLPVGSQLSSIIVKQKQKTPLSALSKETVSLSPLDPYGPTSVFGASRTTTNVDDQQATIIANNSNNINTGSMLPSFSLTQTTSSDSVQSSSSSIPATPNPTPQQSGRASPASGCNSVTYNNASASASVINGLNNRKTSVEDGKIEPLTDVLVPLHTIKPGVRTNLVIMDQGGLKMVLHYAANRPRDDVVVGVISLTSTRSEPISDVSFHGEISSESPTNCVLKVQDASARELPGYNPIFPQNAITLVLLVAANTKVDKISIDYSLTFTYEEKCHSVSGCFDMELELCR